MFAKASRASIVFASNPTVAGLVCFAGASCGPLGASAAETIFTTQAAVAIGSSDATAASTARCASLGGTGVLVGSGFRRRDLWGWLWRRPFAEAILAKEAALARGFLVASTAFFSTGRGRTPDVDGDTKEKESARKNKPHRSLPIIWMF